MAKSVVCFVLLLALFVSTVPARADGGGVAIGSVVVVDPGVRYQTFQGWGTSLCWFANVVGRWPEPERSEITKKIFGQKDGLGLTVVRYNIGGGENPAVHTMQYRARMDGFEPSPGVWDWTADPGQRWMLAESLKLGVNHVEAFSNSPPYWMTISGSATGEKNGDDNLAPENFAPFSDYLIQVVKHFKTDWNVQFDSLEPLNEPDGHWWQYGGRQEGCYLDVKSQDTLLGLVGNQLQSTGLKTILSADDSSIIDDTVSAFQQFSPSTMALISRINTHTYGGSQRTELLQESKADGKDLWVSEYGDGDATGIRLAHRIVKDMRQIQPTAWVYWQMVDTGSGWGCFVSPLDNATDTAYSVNEKYYVFKGFTQFIKPGAQLISINDDNALAAYDQSKKTLGIVLVGGTQDRTETLDLTKFAHLPRRIEIYRTSPTENLANAGPVKLSHGMLTVSVPANSIVSLKGEGVRQ